MLSIWHHGAQHTQMVEELIRYRCISSSNEFPTTKDGYYRLATQFFAQVVRLKD